MPGGIYAICDFRRILRPPIAPFIAVEVPAIITPQVLQDALFQVLPHLGPFRAIFVDQARLDQGISIGAAACTITFVGWSPASFSWHSTVQPAVMDTVQATGLRPGFLPTFTSARLRSESTGSTTTSTTMMRPSAGTGFLGSSGSSNSSPSGDHARAQGSASQPASSNDGLATNPGLLDFVEDPLAIHRVSPFELPNAFTLFDATLQTRLATRDASWSDADCFAEAFRHFTHLSAHVILNVVTDEVAGLPSPQITAIAQEDSLRSRAIPVDARSVGFGICVVNIPKSATPFTTAYLVSSHCNFRGLQHRVAKGSVSAFGRGRGLPPFVEMDLSIDSLYLNTDVGFARPPQPSRAASQRALELVEDLRDLYLDSLANPEELLCMVHSPTGPPLQISIQRHWSLQRIEEEAGEAFWPFCFQSSSCLHFPGAIPRGTDCLLHFFMEIDGSCGETNTFALFDGRALHVDGPPFRTAMIPRRISLSQILHVARSLFRDGDAALAIRVNGRTVTRWEVREYSFPLIRLLCRASAGHDDLPADDSCLPSSAVVSFFPGLLATTIPEEEPPCAEGSAHHRTGCFHFLGDFDGPVSCFQTLHDDPIPFGVDAAPRHDLYRQFEVVVSSTLFPTFRLWAPTTSTVPQLCHLISVATGCDISGLRWPRVVPCLPGQPLLTFAQARDTSPNDRLAVVDARQVHPTQGSALWAVALPEVASTSEITAIALGGRQIASTPFCTRVDGRRCHGLLRFHRGIFLLTISANDCSSDVIALQSRAQLPVGLYIHTSCPARSSTTTTTCAGCFPLWTANPTSTTTTSPCLPPASYPLVTFYATSGLSQPFSVHAGFTLDCAELLGAASFHFFGRRVVPSMAPWMLSSRVFQLANGRWGIFLFTGHGTHEPSSAAVWVDVGPLWPHPYPIHVPSFATWDAHLDLGRNVIVSVNGIRWDGELRFFANAFVIQVRHHHEELISRPLHQFADRFTGLLALQCPCIGPDTSQWHHLTPLAQRDRFRDFYFRWFCRAEPLTVCEPPFATVLIFISGIGAFRFSIGTRLPPSVEHVQAHFDLHLAPRIGDGVVEDLKFVWGEDCLFLVRRPFALGAIWVHLDGDNIDFWEPNHTQDLSQIPTRSGHVLYPADAVGDFGFVVRQPITDVSEHHGPSRVRDFPRTPPFLCLADGKMTALTAHPSLSILSTPFSAPLSVGPWAARKSTLPTSARL